MTTTRTLRVLTIRSQNPRGFGGCIFTGTEIDGDGNVLDAKRYFLVMASSRLLGEAQVQVGQWWRVDGEPKDASITVNGYALNESKIDAKDAELLRPSGEHIVAFIAESNAFAGIGWVKARKLWEQFGDDLYVHLETGNVNVLATVLTEDCATRAISAWSAFGDKRTLQWLQQRGIDLALGRKIINVFGSNAVEKIEDDPYRLLSFTASWRVVDMLAKETFHVPSNDLRRLLGAVEEACYRLFSAGHTTAPLSRLESYLDTLVGCGSGGEWRELISASLNAGFSNGSFVIDENAMIAPVGARVMEQTVARAVASRVLSDDALLSTGEVRKLLDTYEIEAGVVLNVEQKLAVETIAANAFALVVGGAGTGKTTALRAILKVFDAARVHVYQLALMGRAAKRMKEATGRPAMTIAGFLKNVKDEELSKPGVIVVDEASMIDIILMYRLCEKLPPHIRIVLLGDHAQIMPVGPGLVLHALVATPGLPKVELVAVKRYGGEILAAAQAIREGVWPTLGSDVSAPISFIERATSRRISTDRRDYPLAESVLRLYEQDPGNTQILCARRNGLDGVKFINSLCQAQLTAGAKPLTVFDRAHDALAYTGFRLGDKLLCTANLWDWGLQNGSLGHLVEIEEEPRVIRNDEGEEIGYALGWVEWDDGERRPVIEDMLDSLELGYAITIHKSQGSQWPRIIVCVTSNRFLDRTLVYTAVTRAQRQVVLVGDEMAAIKHVEKCPRSRSRNVALSALTTRCFDLAEASS